MIDSGQSIAWLKQRLGNVCVDVPVQGDHPLLLDDPSTAYITLSEHHQLFCVGYEQGTAVGRREHVAICEPGQLLFGLTPPSGPGATALVLSGVTGSVVWRIPTALLFRLLGDPEGREIVAALFDSWLQLLMQTLPSTPVPTKHVALRPGQTVGTEEAMPASRVVRGTVSALFTAKTSAELAHAKQDESVRALNAAEGLVWMQTSERPQAYRGIELSEDASRVAYWPLTEESWGLCGAGVVQGWSTADLLTANKGATFADGFYAFVVSVVAARRALLARGRLERDASSRDADGAMVSDALYKLARVGSGRRLEDDISGEDAFDRACRIIAHWMGITPPLAPKPQGSGLSHMQGALSRMTGIRTRSVLLERGWQQHDSGPLLGFMSSRDGESVHPVAILPSPYGYEVHDPRDGTKRRVTSAIAEALHPQAYQFYAPMPAELLKPFDVLRFASRGARRDVLFVIGIGLGTGSLGTLIPLLTGQVFDRIIPGAERDLLKELTLVLVGVYIGMSLFDLARGFVLVRAQTRMDATLEAGVWDRLLNLPVPFFRKYSAGDLAARAAGIGNIREVLAGTSMSVILSGLFSTWNFALLFYIDPRLAIGATGLVVIAAGVASIAAYYSLQRQRIVAEIDGRIGGLVLQLLSGIAKLRVSGAENRAFSVWANLFTQRRDADLGAERVGIRVGTFQSAFPILSSMALFWMLAGGGRQTLTTGQFLAFSAAFAIFLRAVLDLVETGLESLNVIPMYERAKPILEQKVESQGRGDKRPELQGAIEVSHVSFRYEPDGPLILDDVDFRIEPQEFVAIVGPSGSGKSTLLRLLLGFEECAEGGIFFDGQALSSLDVRIVRQQIGVVLQNSRLTAGDIYSNIVGNTGLDIEAAWKAASSAALADDIKAMPMGMHTVISQGGGTLSGGQRQRLYIARALATDPRILFFDEATSALDNLTQSQVSESLDRLRVTRVVIAHRLSTIQHADKIVVMDRGRVVQMGRFKELIDQEGLFRVLAMRQMT